MMERFAGSAALLLVTCCVGCGSADGSDGRGDGTLASSKSFVGAVSGTDAVIAVSESDGRWVAYVCGGPLTYSTLTRWFQGELDPHASLAELGATHRTDTFAATREGDWVRGTLNDYAFEARAIDVRASKIAGLYSVVDSGCRTGLIAIPGSDAMQGVWCDGAGNFEQVTPIHPIQLSDRGLLVSVNDIGRRLYMQPTVPPLR